MKYSDFPFGTYFKGDGKGSDFVYKSREEFFRPSYRYQVHNFASKLTVDETYKEFLFVPLELW